MRLVPERLQVPGLFPPETVRRSKFQDPHEIRVANWIEPWDFGSPLDVGILWVPFNRAAITPNAANAAPNALRDVFAGLTTYTPDFDVDLAPLRVRDLGEVATPITDPVGAISTIEETLLAAFRLPVPFFPVIVGGDHSITAPAVRAWSRARPDRQVGLIHFDAHNDVRVMDHGPTNGTPIRGILQSDARVAGRNLVQVGIHGFMNASYYKRWVEGRGGTIVTAREIRRTGIDSVITRALSIAGDGTDTIYVTVDIDVLELAYAPGTGVASAEGIHPTDLAEALFTLGKDPRVGAIDFVELDPRRDIAQVTTRTFAGALLTFLAGLYLRLNPGSRGYDPTPVVD
jgi:formiminoglutamase